MQKKKKKRESPFPSVGTHISTKSVCFALNVLLTHKDTITKAIGHSSLVFLLLCHYTTFQQILVYNAKRKCFINVPCNVPALKIVSCLNKQA